MVYIREAHPTDEWQLASNVDEHVLFPQARSRSEREAVANSCAAGMRLEIPILVDGMDDGAERAFNAWPERLYVLSREGAVIYKGGKGPYGFDPDALEEFLQRLLPVATSRE